MGNKTDFADLIMSRIEKEKVKIRSKYIVWAVNFIKNGVFITSLTTNAVFVSFIFYWLKSTQSLDFLTFGKLGLFAFLQSLPYLWLVTSLVFFAITGFILKQYDIAYKKPYKLLLALILIFTGFSGSLINATGANELIAEQIKQHQNKKEAYLKPIWDSEVGIKEKNGVYGKVVEVKPGILQLCIAEETVAVSFDQISTSSKGEKIKKNDWIRAVGVGKNGSFEAVTVKKMEEELTSEEPNAEEQNIEKQNNQNSSSKKEPLQQNNKSR